MNKSELIEKVAGEASLSKSDAEKAVNAFIGVVEAAVATGCAEAAAAGRRRRPTPPRCCDSVTAVSRA